MGGHNGHPVFYIQVSNMSIFSKFETDHKAEVEGISVPVMKNEDGTICSFTVARMEPSNKVYAACHEKVFRPYRELIERDLIDDSKVEELAREVFCDVILVGWENVRDDDGADIEYSKETALDLMKKLPDLENKLVKAATNAALFNKDLIEADAKK